MTHNCLIIRPCGYGLKCADCTALARVITETSLDGAALGNNNQFEAGKKVERVRDRRRASNPELAPRQHLQTNRHAE